jgi:hypothetical protein
MDPHIITSLPVFRTAHQERVPGWPFSHHIELFVEYMRTFRLFPAVLTAAFNMHLAFGQSAQQESTKHDLQLAAGRLVG